MIRLEPEGSRRLLSGQIMWFALWAVITGFAIYLTPSPDGHGTHTQLGLAPCPSVFLFSKPCPGCGLTTSFTATVHGDIGHAFRSHIFGPILYSLFTVSALLCGYGWVRRHRVTAYGKLYNWFIIGLLSTFIGFGAIRFFMAQDYAKPGERALPFMSQKGEGRNGS